MGKSTLWGEDGRNGMGGGGQEKMKRYGEGEDGRDGMGGAMACPRPYLVNQLHG
jgi:hypothetical protein